MYVHLTWRRVYIKGDANRVNKTKRRRDSERAGD